MQDLVFTVGHSTHSVENFLHLLRVNGITAIGDVRSSPYSRSNSQFNREFLKKSLKEAGIAYVFLGDELGARSNNPLVYQNGKAAYHLIAQTEAFKAGLERVRDGSKTFNIALMCAEKDPLNCHRTILVGRYLAQRGVRIKHILADGSIEEHDDAIGRLVAQLGLHQEDMFGSSDEFRNEAYAIQGERIAYEDEKMKDGSNS